MGLDEFIAGLTGAAYPCDILKKAYVLSCSAQSSFVDKTETATCRMSRTGYGSREEGKQWYW